jgi:hypothetical protein
VVVVVLKVVRMMSAYGVSHQYAAALNTYRTALNIYLDAPPPCPPSHQAGRLRIPRSGRAVVARSILTRSQDYFEEGHVVQSLRYAQTAVTLQQNLGMAHYQVKGWRLTFII